ncbi:MCE family protein [Amycolatopsis sp. lyj-112]|uniref:MCE family protein n=1 Tax=Amycolatopsis sp. lyj-112 TaxID=2789288 RepID=UPI00397957CD
MRRTFRERDPAKLAGAGLFLLITAVAAAIVLPQVVFYQRTTDYAAELANASGLRPDDQVFIAGVPSGRVRTVELAGDRVRVGLRLDHDQTLGAATTAGVKLQTILGKRYLDVQPRGDGRIPAGGTIPLARTSVPFSLDDLGRSAAKTTEQLDLGALKQMISTLRQNTPDANLAAQALRGVGAATTVFDKYSEQLKGLLAGAQSVTGTLVSQQDSLVKLLGDADLITKALVDRKATLETLIADLASLSTQVRSFLDTHRPIVKPLLDRLETVSKTLAENQRQIGRTLDLLAPAGRYLANAGGNGPWLDVTGPAGPVPDDILCALGVVKGCK